jgi:putative ABC transport system substrate-binding protein
MRRRDFITLLGGAVVAPTMLWPLTARAQQNERVRRIGLLVPFSENDPAAQTRLAVFKKYLQDVGWTDGRNIRFDFRYTGENPERIRSGAAELVAIAPDVIVCYSNGATAALQQATRVIPIVFAQVSNPVESGYVASLARPGGNITGFMQFEIAIGGKWLQVLKELAPGVRRVAVVHSPDSASNVSYLRAAEAAAASLGVTVTAVAVRAGAEIEHALTVFAQEPNGGLIVAPHPVTMATGGKPIIALAERLHLPAIYPFRFFPTSGGLVSYGPDEFGQWRGAASYVDRILRGTNPGELPVQLPTKYETILNLRTAKALGLTVPPSVLARADEVIE